MIRIVKFQLLGIKGTKLDLKSKLNTIVYTLVLVLVVLLVTEGKQFQIRSFDMAWEFVLFGINTISGKKPEPEPNYLHLSSIKYKAKIL